VRCRYEFVLRNDAAIGGPAMVGKHGSEPAYSPKTSMTMKRCGSRRVRRLLTIGMVRVSR